jgi:hypothetical protein
MLGWGALAGSVVAIEAVLSRRGTPLLSHEYWTALGSRHAPLVVAGWAALTWHLNVPHRRWRHALGFGAAAGVAHWLSTREEP